MATVDHPTAALYGAAGGSPVFPSRSPLLLWCVIVLSWLSGIGVARQDCQMKAVHGKSTAECTNKQLKVIPKGLDHDLQVLTFTDNLLTYLAKDEFKRYPALQEIILVRNSIELIAPDAFRSLYNLQRLDLEGNKLKSIPPRIFQHLRSLRILSLKSNPLDVLTKDAFKDLKNIEELNFENCWIERIDPETFKGLDKLVEVNLVNNELMSLHPRMQTYLPSSLNVLRLYRNPWACDCKLRWLRHYVEENEVAWDFITNVPVCDSPPLLHSIPWRTLGPDKFTCPAEIITSNNASTSIELEVHGNVTIDCIVRGDHQPTITWKRGNALVAANKITERPCTGEDGERRTCSALTFNDLQLSDAGDYRCIAQNKAGRSEITYKLWVHDPAGPHGTTLYGLTPETLIGIGIGAGVLVLLLVACIVWTIKRKDRNHLKTHLALKSNYKKSSQNGQDNHSPSKNKNHITYDQVEDSTTAPAMTEIISDKESKTKKTTEAVISPELIPINNHKAANAVVTDITADTEPKVTTANPQTQQTQTQQETTRTSPTKNKEFKMKIFQHDEPDTATDLGDASNTQQKQQGTNDLSATKTTSSSAAAGHNNDKSVKTSSPIEVVIPDLVRRPDNSHQRSKKSSPDKPPNGQLANHLQHHQPSHHKRAEENPYAKPSDMKQAASKTTPQKQNSRELNSSSDYSGTLKPKDSGSAGTLRRTCGGGGNAREPALNQQQAAKRETNTSSQDPFSKRGADNSGNTMEKKKVTTFSVDASSPCKNPICLKEQTSKEPKPKSPTKRTSKDPQPPHTSRTDLSQQQNPHHNNKQQHIKSSQSMSGISSTADYKSNPTSPTPSRDSVQSSSSSYVDSRDRYKTLPSRSRVHSPSSDDGNRRQSANYGKHAKTAEDRCLAPPQTHQTSSSPKYHTLGHHHSANPSSVSTVSMSPHTDFLPATKMAPGVSSTLPQKPLHSILRNPLNKPPPQPQQQEPQIHGFQPSMPPDPLATQVRSKTLTPKLGGSRSGAASPNERVCSPTRKLPRSYESTSLDDLLSPPFGHIQVNNDRPKSPRTQSHKMPKPGEKDEYGTAV